MCRTPIPSFTYCKPSFPAVTDYSIRYTPRPEGSHSSKQHKCVGMHTAPWKASRHCERDKMLMSRTLSNGSCSTV